MEYPIKHTLVLNLSKELNIPESVIDAVIAHEVESAKIAMNNAKSIEFSGFGRFYFNEGRARKKLKRYLDFKSYYEKLIEEENDAGKRVSLQIKLHAVISQIALMKTKLKE